MNRKGLLIIMVALILAPAVATAETLRRGLATPPAIDDEWVFNATHDIAGQNGGEFVNEIPMGPFLTEAVCVAANLSIQTQQPSNNVDFVPYNGIFKTTCCMDLSTGATVCPTK